MVELELEVRKWGNSLGIVIPVDVAKAEDLHARDHAYVRITKVRMPDPRSYGFLRAGRGA